MNEKIVTGLKQLDVKTDAQWTQEGLVNLNAFKFVIGGEAVTREQLEEVAPGFNRENAATYFDEKKKEDATLTEGTVTDASLTAGVENGSDIVDTEEGSKPNDTLIYVINALRQDYPVLSELSDEDLAKYAKESEKVRNAINAARDEFQTLTQNGLLFLNELSGEVDRRTPVTTIADQVKAIHFAQSNQTHIVDQGRQRVAPVVPPLVRK